MIAAAEAWAFRARVERDAAKRFARLASEIEAFDPQSPVPAMMRKAALDEERHLQLCISLAGAVPTEGAAGAERVAPASLPPREATLYETVAACCITETESVATVTSLLAADALPHVRAVLHEIARDEVSHARMGWAHLAREASAIDVRFLGRWIPAMLSGASASGEPPESTELLRYGVLPASQKRAVFAQTLLEVVFPGLEQFGIATAAGREWLSERTRAAAAAGPR